MSTLFVQGGFYMWPLLVLAIIIVVLSIKKIIDLFFKKNLNQLQLESGVNSILFWGGLSLLLGFLGHYHGMYLAMLEISRASDISPAVVAMGYGVSLITVMFGLLNLLLAAIAWFVLRWRLKKLTAKND
jgi:biopolymer transport protein ExbB/TolQ